MKIFFCLSLLLFTSLSYASRARLQALSNSYHLNDPQKIYAEPLNIHYAPDLILFESGTTTATGASDYAEGLTVMSLDEETRLAIGLGHQPDAVAGGRTFINAVTGLSYELAQNPVYAVYGWKTPDTAYVLGMYHSTRRDRLTDAGEVSTGFTAGIELGRFQLYADYNLANNARLASGELFDAGGTFSGTVNYLFETIIFYFRYSGEDLRSYTAAGPESDYHRRHVVSAGLVDSRRRNRNDTFWGMELTSVNVDCRLRAGAGCSASASSITLPLWLGLEIQALDELVFRGSVRQNFLVMQSKDRVGYPAGLVPGSGGAPSEFSAGVNSTVVAMGAGLRFNRVTVDGVFSTATTGVLDSANLFSQLGVTYRF